jgi:hypothetical protein
VILVRSIFPMLLLAALWVGVVYLVRYLIRRFKVSQ